MGRDRLPRDDRGVSESAGVGVLIALTVLVTASVGISVLFIPSEAEQGTNATFSFDHFPDSGQLLVTHEDGDAIPAGDIVVSGESKNLTWASILNVSTTKPVEPGDAVQLSDSSAWEDQVQQRHDIAIYYVPNATSAKLLDRWEP